MYYGFLWVYVKEGISESIEKWIKKMWYIYPVECYSDIKRNETGAFIVMWMNLESVIQSEVSQKEKNKYFILMHIYGL